MLQVAYLRNAEGNVNDKAITTIAAFTCTRAVDIIEVSQHRY